MAEANSLTEPNRQVGDTFEGYILPNANALIDPANGVYAWVQDIGAVSAAVEITADPAPATRGSFIATYAAAGAFTLDALANFGVGDEIELTNTDGTAITVTPAAGEILNGNVDGTYISDTQRQRVVIEKISATEWAAGPNQVAVDAAEVELINVEGVNNTLYPFSTGETWAQVKERYSHLRVTGNASQSGTNNIRPYSHIIDLDASVLEPYEVNLGGSVYRLDDTTNSVSVSISDPSDTDTGLTYLQSGGDAPTSGRMQFRVVGVLRREMFQAGTLIAEPNTDLLVEALAGDGATVDWSAADLTQYDYLDFYLEAISSTSGPFQFSRRVPVDRVTSAVLWQGDGVNTFSMTVNAAGTIGTMSYAGTFNVAGTQRVYGVRKQYNAIRVEDAKIVVLTGNLPAGGALATLPIPATHSGKALIDVHVMVEFTAGSGDYYDSYQDSGAGFSVRFDPAVPQVDIGNRAGGWTGANGWRAICTYA